MRKLTQLVLLASVLVAGPAFADMKIAVLNYQMALLESDAAKKYAVDAEKKFGPQLTQAQDAGKQRQRYPGPSDGRWRQDAARRA